MCVYMQKTQHSYNPLAKYTNAQIKNFPITESVVVPLPLETPPNIDKQKLMRNHVPSSHLQTFAAANITQTCQLYRTPNICYTFSNFPLWDIYYQLR